MLFSEQELNECACYKGVIHAYYQSFFWSRRWYSFLENETRFLKNY